MRNLKNEELMQVFGGGDSCCYEPCNEGQKGNNGWGNGEDTAPATKVCAKLP
jgi:hypothetical protein